MTTQNDQLLATTAKLREVLGLAGQSSKTILEASEGSAALSLQQQKQSYRISS
jgi:hypothetical protein